MLLDGGDTPDVVVRPESELDVVEHRRLQVVQRHVERAGGDLDGCSVNPEPAERGIGV